MTAETPRAAVRPIEPSPPAQLLLRAAFLAATGALFVAWLAGH